MQRAHLRAFPLLLEEKGRSGDEGGIRDEQTDLFRRILRREVDATEKSDVTENFTFLNSVDIHIFNSGSLSFYFLGFLFSPVPERKC